MIIFILSIIIMKNDQHIKVGCKNLFSQILDYKYGAYYTDEQTEEKLLWFPSS